MNHIKFSIFTVTVYCLHDSTYTLLRASRQLSIICFVFCYVFVYLFVCLFNFWHWQFQDAICLMLMYINVAKFHLFNGLHVSVIGQD